MQTQIVTSLHPTSSTQPDLRLRLRAEILLERRDFQPISDRLRIIYLTYINRDDELSVKIQNVAFRFICTDYSKISQLSEIIKIAQDCRNQFDQVLYSDFDFANLETPGDFNRALLEKPAELRGWKFDEWQIKDFINLDKYFGQIIEQRSEVLSPFDGEIIPEELPGHEFAQAIVDLLRTIPEFLQEAIPPQAPPQRQAVVANQMGQRLLALPHRGNSPYKLTRQDVENNSLEKDWKVAYGRWGYYKKMAKSAVQLKINQTRLVQLEIDIAARKLANENFLHEMIDQEAQRMLAYFEERQQVVDAHLEELEQARGEIAKLKVQLDESTKNLNKLRADLSVQEKKSEDLQQQIYVEQAKYARLAQEIQELRNRCRRRPWWKFW